MCKTTLSNLKPGDRFRPTGSGPAGEGFPVWEVIRFAGERKLYARIAGSDDEHGSSFYVDPDGSDCAGGQTVELVKRKRTLGDLTPIELAESIERELTGLDAKLQNLLVERDASEPITGTDLLIVNAYLGSVRARAAVLTDALRDAS